MQSLICNVASGTELLKCFDDTSVPDAPNRVCAPHAGSSGQASSGHANYGPSPHPALDKFIESVCSEVCAT